MRIGITGHSNLSPPTELLVSEALRRELGGVGRPLVGVSCLARGADQLFARAVLEAGGALEVVLPARDYRERKVWPDNRALFDDLIRKATTVTTLPYPEAGRDAYVAASERVLAGVEALIAVWDGQPADGRGGTADVVASARDRGLPFTIVWPSGASRSERHAPAPPTVASAGFAGDPDGASR